MKCPKCNGVPDLPYIRGCLGCIDCDFTGTKEGYDAMQVAFEEAMEALTKMNHQENECEEF